MTLQKVLVANRGEIAVRILRTLRALEIASVAVYSDVDRYAPHVLLADEAVHLGPPPPRQSYLDGERLLAAAAYTGADAVHPGYGFLSEDAAFARACEATGVQWIGPTPDHLEQFGRKDAARALARAAGVPLLAGSDGLRDLDDALGVAADIGYPVMLKSRAGGGGIGMRRCDTAAALTDAFEIVTRLARVHFGDDVCFLERCIVAARHVEVQVFGDGRGEVIALGERDCSVQRRNQKVIEETPAPNLDDATRAALARAAVALTRAVAYRSAGTVEFVVDATTGEYAFLEVNARLQVEHAVTEMVTGVDLVEWMVRLARGDLAPLPELAATTQPRGAAIEARLYAEDPAHEYRPSAGTVTEWVAPERARVDTWLTLGTELTSHYDPLLAKIVVRAETRTAAIDALTAALAETRVGGIETNLALLRVAVADPRFRTGAVATNLLDGVDTTAIDRAIEIVVPGAQTTVQDWPGRVGLWDVGVPPSGPMDDLAFRFANRLAGSEAGAAALECTMTGPTLRFSVAAVVALAGAHMVADLDGASVPWWTAFEVGAGQVLRLGAIDGPGARTYLAVRGGFDVPEYLGSRSTFILGRFGGHAGRAVVAGDVLHVGAAVRPDAPDAGVSARVATDTIPVYANAWELSVLPGPHAEPDFFTPADIAMLRATEWEVHHHSDRTGVRLVGPAPQWARSDGGEAGLHPSNIHDNVYAIGTIDFTGDMPIVLGPDGPSLGGFVCPATVATADRWKLGQLRAGDHVRLRPITHADALALTERRAHDLQSLGVTATTRTSRATGSPSTDATPGESAVLHFDSADATRPALTIRRAGDEHVLVEFGPNILDLDLRVRAHALHQALAAAAVDGVAELAPGIRSLQVRYDPRTIPVAALLAVVVEAESKLPAVDEIEIPSRIVHLPLAWNDSQTQLATERYQRLVRPDAPWCPSNLEFIRRINGLDSIDDVRRVVFDATYLVLGLGDVYLGAPVATPVDPRHRLVTTKYNPARTWTPENAVGIGGAYLCVYGMEGPGGYQFVGRTVQMWNRWFSPRGFDPGRPWLLRFFDQLRFFPVSEEELLERRAAIAHGATGTDVGVDIEPTVFRLADHHAFLASHAAEIATFQSRRDAAFARERARWKELGVAEYVNTVPEPDAVDDEPVLAPGELAVAAPVQGIVWRMLVAPGDDVAAGDVVAIVEAMKTEVSVSAPCAGRVRALRCTEGALVRAGQTLVVLA
ncbi:MAG: urea carboxylase [Actinomycetia bacterium]|nr:urea carboxylase [Actinomycetes bacterium]